MARKASNGVHMRDVAKKAGVSMSTVSFVLSGKWIQNRVHPETAIRVRETALKMGYTGSTYGQRATALREWTAAEEQAKVREIVRAVLEWIEDCAEGPWLVGLDAQLEEFMTYYNNQK